MSMSLRLPAFSPMAADTRMPNTAANDRRIIDNDSVIGASDRDRTLLVVDAACDMPSEWLANNRIAVLPIAVGVDDWKLLDTHNEFDAMEFFRKDLSSRGARAATTPLNADEAREFVQSNLDLDIDYILQITISATRSKIYLNSLAAMHGLTASHNRVRRGLGNRDPFHTWVIDSETGFAGQGVMIADAVRQLNNGVPAPAVAASLEKLRRDVHTFVVPKDLYYMYDRARAKGDKSVSWLSYNVARTLDIKPVIHANGGETRPVLKLRGHYETLDHVMTMAADHVKRGLLTPTVCVSYAGNLEDVRTMNAFRDLRTTCKWHRVELVLSTMSMTGGINVGADAFSIAFATDSLQIR